MTTFARLRLPLIVVTASFLLLAIVLSFQYAPSHSDMGETQRIFYFHVASAWIAYVGFAVTFATSIIYIVSRNLAWDDWAFSSAQIGVVFCTIAITTGPMWAKSVWGVYWYWNDLKLLMTLILWLVFIAYLAIRANVDARRTKATLSGIFSIIGMICIPLSFAANRWWTTIHPTIIASEKGVIETSEMVPALVVSVFAFTFLYVTLLLLRVEILKLREKVGELKQEIGD